MEKIEQNLIKRVSKELGLTYAQLAEQIGYSEGNINKVASTGNISEPLKKAIELYLKTIKREDLLYIKNNETETKEKINPIKAICEKFQITYDELSSEIGYGADSIRNTASTGKISEPMRRALELFEENRILVNENSRIKILSKLKDFNFESCSTNELLSINSIIENMQ